MTTTTTDWRDSMSAHDDALQTVDLEALRGAVGGRLAEVRELTATAEQRIAWAADIDGRYSGRPDGPDGARDTLAHVLANLNSARLHLDDITGC